MALKHGAMKAGPSGSGWGGGERRGERGGRDSEWKKGYYTFFIKFPGTKPHQSVSEIEGVGGGGERQDVLINFTVSPPFLSHTISFL